MRDDFSKEGSADTGRLNLDEPWERRYWAEFFGVTEMALSEAAEAVGSQAESLRKHFRAPPKMAR